MDGRFASLCPVWRAGVSLNLDVSLAELTRDTLEHLYNNEMKRRRAAGDDTARELTSTWQKKPKSAIEAKVRELINDGAQLVLPPTLDETSQPQLLKGTRLVARKHTGARQYAIVESFTPAGKLRLRLFEAAIVEHIPAQSPYGDTATRYTRLAKRYPFLTLAVFMPSAAPGGYNAGDHWTLETHGDKLFGDLRWQLEPADEGDGVAVEWIERHESHD
jgi:hypothetical protein